MIIKLDYGKYHLLKTKKTGYPVHAIAVKIKKIMFVNMSYFKQFELITLKYQIPRKQFLCMICRNVVDHQEFQKLCKLIMNKKKQRKGNKNHLNQHLQNVPKNNNHLVLILNQLVIILNKLDTKLIPFSKFLR